MFKINGKKLLKEHMKLLNLRNLLNELENQTFKAKT